MKPSKLAKTQKSRVPEIRLLVIEDNRLLREGISAMLLEHGDIQVVASLGTGENIMQKIRNVNPHVALLDLGLRNQNSLELVKHLKTECPGVKTIVMDLIPTQEDVLAFVRAGASGFVLKDATIEDFLHTIRSVASGSNVLPAPMTRSLFSQIVEYALNGNTAISATLVESVRLTKREREVMGLVSDGMSNKEIAHNLHLSTYTVKSHVHNILEKLTLHTRVQIATYSHTSPRSLINPLTVSRIAE